MAMEREMNTQNYRKMINTLRENEYNFVQFDELDPRRRNVVMRHDVDFSLEYASKIASIDEEENLRSVFFILVSSEFYNINSKLNRHHVDRIVAQGHTIGLHFDPTVYDGEAVAIENAAVKECEILQNYLDAPISITAYHRPGAHRHILGKPGLFAGRPHAYAPEYFSEIGYVSDSTGEWSYGHPTECEAFKKGTAFQLLTHPYLWVQDDSLSALEKIERFRQEKDAMIVSELRRNLRYYT